MNYLDRYLSIFRCDKHSFQLAAMTTLYLALKVSMATDNENAASFLVSVTSVWSPFYSLTLDTDTLLRLSFPPLKLTCPREGLFYCR